VRTVLALISAGLLYVSAASAQDDAANYPNRPIRIIVCVPAGGGVDTVTRIVANGLQQRLGQPVVVENRAGAAGNIGAEAVFTSDPDGYTLLAAQPSPLTVNPLLYKTIAFDPTQFEPVAIMTTVANVLLVRPDFPAKTAQEFIVYAKANPGKINYASQGIGTTSHLTAALFEKVTGTKLVHVPYKGTAPALNDIIASHVDFIFMELASAIKLHQGGKARILAVAYHQAHCEPARHPDAGRGRREGIRIRHLERHRRAAEDPAGDRRQAQPGDQRGAQQPGRAGQVRQDQPACRRRYSCRSECLHYEGNAGLGRGDQRGACPGALRCRWCG
jgi:tripartite-type tricarboxylate transporter receptor subunit TctC